MGFYVRAVSNWNARSLSTLKVTANSRSVLAIKWFNTLFVNSLLPKKAIRTWDIILQDGLFVVIKISIAFFKSLQKDLLRLDICGIDHLFKYIKGEISIGRKSNQTSTIISKPNRSKS